MIVAEGARVRLTGRAWGYASQNREVYARITFADHGHAKIDEQDVLISGSFVNGYEFEVVETIDVVFDGPPAAESGRFVEVEDMAGASIRIGEWVERGDGFWALRIPLGATPMLDRALRSISHYPEIDDD